jgi:hypothetical protein
MLILKHVLLLILQQEQLPREKLIKLLKSKLLMMPIMLISMQQEKQLVCGNKLN